jgi:hypothetical protein
MSRSAIITLLAGAGRFAGHTELGELPEPVLRLMALPEPVAQVQADNRVLFHEADKGKLGAMRKDTATWQWLSDWAPVVVTTPTWYAIGNKPYTYQLIREMEPHPNYPTIRYMRLILKYVPSVRSDSHAPEIWLRTYIPQPYEKIKSTLQKAIPIPYP